MCIIAGESHGGHHSFVTIHKTCDLSSIRQMSAMQPLGVLIAKLFINWEGKGYHMSLSGIGNNNTADLYAIEAEKKENTSSKVDTTKNEAVAGTEEKEKPAAVYDKRKLSDEDRKSIVAQLKADQEKRQNQLTDLVHSMLNTQTNTFGEANNIWQFLAKETTRLMLRHRKGTGSHLRRWILGRKTDLRPHRIVRNLSCGQ